MTEPHFKLGRLPAKRPFGLADLSVYAVGPLPAPPTAVAAPVATYPIDGNDVYGDCTIAGVAHLITGWDVEFAEHDPIPTGPEVVAEYFKLTGGPDVGLCEADVLQTWQTGGLFGEKIAGYAPINPRHELRVHQAIAFYGGAYLGIYCPESAQHQFENGEPWTFVPHSPILGGHCIVALGYTPTALLCATWGRVIEVTYPFLNHYLEEAWCVLSHQLVEAKHDTLGIDIGALRKDLANV